MPSYGDSSEVRLAPHGSVYVAPIGTTLPSTATIALNAAFKVLGYITEDGVSMTPSVDLTDIMMWQSNVPVKTATDTISFEVSFTMGQLNVDTFALYYFNTAVTNNFGQGKLSVPSSPGSQEKALIVEWQDDLDDQTRLVIPRAVLTDREAMNLVRNGATTLGVTFRALDNSGQFFDLLSDNPDLVPTS